MANITSLNKELMILDTGDNYILGMNGEGYADALGLYREMDLTINEIPTNYFVNKDSASVIFDSIGKVISYGFSDTDGTINMNIPDKLKVDIGKAIEFSKIRSFWENIQFPAKPKKKYDHSMYADTLTYSKLLPHIDSMNHEKLHIYTPNPLQRMMNNDQLYVVFNTIYNLALVIEENKLGGSMAALTANFPDFVNAIQMNADISDDARKSFYGVFHKKSFENLEDIQKKLGAFKDLFNINDTHNKEKTMVKQYFEWNYTITNEVDKRMKANDLYKEVINHMCIPYDDAASFKKRLAGYLIELDLKKKRYSDAYYFYGIEKKDLPQVQLKDIEERRMTERKAWMFSIDIQKIETAL